MYEWVIKCVALSRYEIGLGFLCLTWERSHWGCCRCAQWVCRTAPHRTKWKQAGWARRRTWDRQAGASCGPPAPLGGQALSHSRCRSNSATYILSRYILSPRSMSGVKTVKLGWFERPLTCDWAWWREKTTRKITQAAWLGPMALITALFQCQPETVGANLFGHDEE